MTHKVVDRVFVDGKPYNVIDITINPGDCKDCGFYECVCQVNLQHQEQCRYRKAMNSWVSFECSHGMEACPQCDLCTCK